MDVTGIKTLDQLDAKGKRVIVRVDFNTPMKDGAVADDTRIRAALPTIEELANEGARVILMSHLGRPKGEGYEERFSLAPVAERLGELLGKPVAFATDTVGEDARQKAAALSDGEVLLLENLRFDAREKKNDPEFCEQLAALADAYVNDAFGTAHRAHASTTGLAHLLPAYAGRLVQREVTTLSRLLDEPERPFTAIVGGSKAADKIPVVEALIDKCDILLVGGGLAFTFLRACGLSVGATPVEDQWVERARSMMAKADEQGVILLLPADVVCAKSADATSGDIVDIASIPDDEIGYDIGPATVEAWLEAIEKARTVFWNGPVGVFENDTFANGTRGLAEAMAAAEDTATVIGGGDSAAAVNKLGVADRITFISTGGGASLEFVEGKDLPGIVALKG